MRLPASRSACGLVPALRQLQTEMSRPGVAIDFSHDAIPTPAPDVALSLFRVAQEALQNAFKHGKPTRVAMTLTTEGDGLSPENREPENLVVLRRR